MTAIMTCCSQPSLSSDGFHLGRQRDILREAVFLCSTPFDTPRISSGCASFNAVCAAPYHLKQWPFLHALKSADATDPTFVDFSAIRVAADPFFCGFMVCHKMNFPKLIFQDRAYTLNSAMTSSIFACFQRILS